MEGQDLKALRLTLSPDCSKCFGLCCVAFHYLESEDFPIDKPAGKPCSHLTDTYSCQIHSELRERGFKGCTVYDCLGAGQFISQVTFENRSWRESDVDGTHMFAVLPIMTQTHELLLYIVDLLSHPIPSRDAESLQSLLKELLAFRELPSEQLTGTILMAFRQRARPMFIQLSQCIRASGLRQSGISLTKRHEADRSDLIGRNMSKKDVRGMCYRGALLIGTNFRGQDLSYVDFMGADVRDMDVRGAEMTNSLFLTQMQVNAMNGDHHTKIAPVYKRPFHWR